MNEMIGLIGENSIKYIDIMLDILIEQNIVVLVDWRIPLNISLNMLRQLGINKCYLERTKWKENDGVENMNIIYFDSNKNEAQKLPVSLYKKYKNISENRSKKDAIVFFSSGSTGKAKGVKLSFAAINNNVDAIIDYMHPTSEDSILISKSLAHSSTVIGELFVGLKTNATILIEPTITPPGTVLKHIKKYNISIWCINPTLLSIYSKLLSEGKYQINSLKYVYFSGSIADKHLLEESKRNFKDVLLINVYGLTEAGPRVTAQRLTSVEKIGSVGTPIKGVEVKIISEFGQELPPNSIGVIHVKTMSIMNGYLSGTGKKSFYLDWLNTGDLGYIDTEGDLFVVGRSDNMILYGAHNVYPEEVEIILKKYEKIDDCIVFGIKQRIYGERIVCLYVSSSEVYEKELRNYCTKNLASYEIPHEFHKIEEILYNLNGKCMREYLKEIYKQRIFKDAKD